jgi:CRISPR/Cas system-associated endonuclease Cas1
VARKDRTVTNEIERFSAAQEILHTRIAELEAQVKETEAFLVRQRARIAELEAETAPPFQPIIKAHVDKAIELCAQVAEEYYNKIHGIVPNAFGPSLAAAIRALKEKP